MKRALFQKISASAIVLFWLFASSVVISKESRNMPPAAPNENGCQTVVTVIDLGCQCAGGFVFETDDNRLLIPTYPLPHNPTLQGGQRYRANFVIEEPFELVVDCFDLGCAATGYPAIFTCLQPVRKNQ